jgi:hypothetical protein
VSAIDATSEEAETFPDILVTKITMHMGNFFGNLAEPVLDLLLVVVSKFGYFCM